MKLNTFAKYQWTAELWMPTVLNDANGTIVYVFDRNVSFNLANGTTQTYFYSKEPINYEGVIRKVRNPKGEAPFLVEGVDTDMYVTSSDPIVDIYGNVTGYKQIIRRNKPVTFRGVEL